MTKTNQKKYGGNKQDITHLLDVFFHNLTDVDTGTISQQYQQNQLKLVKRMI